MLECIESIERYYASHDVEIDELAQDAILRKLQIMTESSKRVSDERKAMHPQVPWRELAGFRNVVVHDYLGIRVERIVPIVRDDVPKLKQGVLAILEALQDHSATHERLCRYVSENQRVCPMPQQWAKLYDLLPGSGRVGAGHEPGLPLILAAWGETPALIKILRLREHIDWALAHGAIGAVDAFLRSLPEVAWHHVGD